MINCGLACIFTRNCPLPSGGPSWRWPPCTLWSSDRERAGQRATVRRGAQGPAAGRRALDGYFAYSNFGASFSASFVAPGRTILPSSCLSLAHRHRDLMLADAKEAADADDQRRTQPCPALRSDLDVADLFADVVVDALPEDLLLRTPPRCDLSQLGLRDADRGSGRLRHRTAAPAAMTRLVNTTRTILLMVLLPLSSIVSIAARALTRTRCSSSEAGRWTVIPPPAWARPGPWTG